MSDIHFQRPDGTDASGYLAEPTGQAQGNVIVFHEWFGLTDQIRRTCDKLAEEGFRALAPDLYRGFVAKNAEEAAKAMTELNFGEALSSDVAGALALLASKGGKTAVMGFCMGGALTFAALMNVKGFHAGVAFYGIAQEKAGDPGSITTPLIAHFGSKDAWCNPTAVDALQAKLQKGHAPATIYRYDGADHAFTRHTDPAVFHPEAAKLAYDRTFAFLRAQLA